MYSIILLCLLPLLVLAQNSSTPANTSATTPAPVSFTTITTTSLATIPTIEITGGSRIATLVTSASVFVTVVPIPTASPGNATAGNNTGNNTSSSTTPSKPLPTAPTNNPGGQDGAPVPGATGANGAYGPDDSYIAAASALATKALAATLIGCLVGGALSVI